MSRYSSNLQARLRLEEAKFFFHQMEEHFQDGTKFCYFLDAFLAFARSVPEVFLKEIRDDAPLMNWYNGKAEEWKQNKIMKFFTEMRNITIHEHTPKTMLTREVSFTADAFLVDRFSVEKISPDGTTEQAETPPSKPAKPVRERDEAAPPSPRTVGYSFVHNFEWFNENPDVMHLCQAYLDELEKFVSEAEKMMKRNES